jgi:hypothetical protein
MRGREAAILRHLMAMRSQLDAVIRQLEDASDDPGPAAEPGEPGACRHPEGDRLEAGTLNKPHRFKCRRCGSLVDDGNDGG